MGKKGLIAAAENCKECGLPMVTCDFCGKTRCDPCGVGDCECTVEDSSGEDL